MRELVDIRAVQDWKQYLRGCRPKSVDKELQTQFSMQFKVSSDANAVHVRSKRAVSAKV